jgi:stress-induced morphogen
MPNSSEQGGAVAMVGGVPTTQEIKDRIEHALPGAKANVEDLTGGGDHLRAKVTYLGFTGLSRIEQHKLVYDVFDGEIGGAIHALSLKTAVPRLAASDGSPETREEAP